MIEQKIQQELESASIDQLDYAHKRHQWFSATFSVDPTGKVLTLQETSCDFPFDQFEAAVKLLQKAIDKKRGVAEPEPLPLAPHLDQIHVELSPVGSMGDYVGPAD